jgi:hypothetical protein
MRHPPRAGPATQAAISLAMWPLIIALSPVILVAGEPVNRYAMRRVRRSPPMAGVTIVRTGNQPVRGVTAVRLTLPSSLLLIATSNPLWIALTAPGRWVADRYRRPPSPSRPVSRP